MELKKILQKQVKFFSNLGKDKKVFIIQTKKKFHAELFPFPR